VKDGRKHLRRKKIMIPTIILCSLVVYLGIVNWIDRERANARESQLLTRLMSRDAQDYAIAINRLRQDKKVTQTLADMMEKGEDILPVD